ncbi:MAG: hypothetical protein C0614_10805 [Desulfuromonas sp.]|nr:MAG: hypothetical protein C0614_10805 [Desulfuromonas sp.]
MKRLLQMVTVSVLLGTLLACSLPPIHPVTKRELMMTKLYQKYIIAEPAEQILYALNTRGEVVVEGKRNITGKEFLVYVKLMAASDGIHIHEYDR